MFSPVSTTYRLRDTLKKSGAPLEHLEFINTYEKYFPSSYARYTAFDDECLFAVIQLLSNVGYI